MDPDLSPKESRLESKGIQTGVQRNPYWSPKESRLEFKGSLPEISLKFSSKGIQISVKVTENLVDGINANHFDIIKVQGSKMGDANIIARIQELVWSILKQDEKMFIIYSTTW